MISEDYTARVLDVQGNVHATLDLQDKYVIDIPTLPSGLYFLEIIKNSGETICFRKIIKQ